MADISTELTAIKNAVYGEEVRDSIVDALRKMNVDSTAAVEAQDRAEAAQAKAEEAAAHFTIDTTLTHQGQAADAKKTGDEIGDLKTNLNDVSNTVYGKNRFNINGNIVNGYYLNSSGGLVESQSWCVSDFCYVKGFSDVFASILNDALTSRNNLTMWYTCTYDDNKQFIAQIGNGNTFALGSNVAYIRFCEHVFESEKKIQIESGTYKTSFEPYSATRVLITDSLFTDERLPANSKAVGDAIQPITKKIETVDDVISEIATPKLVLLNGEETQSSAIALRGDIISAGTTAYRIVKYQVVAGKTYYISGSTNYSNLVWCYYDSNNNVIQKGTQASGSSSFTIVFREKTTAPSESSYVLVAYNTNTTQTATCEDIIGYSYSQWSGKKWVVFGDSLTESNSRTTKHYFDYVADTTGITTYNMGNGGSGYIRKKDNGKAFYQRISDVPTDADVITIFGSFNDLGGGYALGTATDIGTDTVGGCINKTIDNLFAVIPTAVVGLVTPTPWVGQNPTTEPNSASQYVNLIKEICDKRSIPCLDLFHCSLLRPWDQAFRVSAYSKDDGNGVHPDETGHKLIAPRFKGFLETLLM